METNTWTTDNRWSPGASGAYPPDNAPAAYSARWIDMGNETPADVVPDRQGFAYNDTGYRDDLIDALKSAGDSFRTPYKVNLGYDETRIVMNTPLWVCYMRRAGGYIYVDAWLTPAATTVSVPETTWQVVCPDGQVRHEGTFETRREAEVWAWYGHPCLATHKFEQVTP